MTMLISIHFVSTLLLSAGKIEREFTPLDSSLLNRIKGNSLNWPLVFNSLVKVELIGLIASTEGT